MHEYNPDVSRIEAMSQVFKDYRNDVNLVHEAEVYYEQLREYNRTSVVSVDLEESLTRIIGNLSAGWIDNK